MCKSLFNTITPSNLKTGKDNLFYKVRKLKLILCTFTDIHFVKHPTVQIKSQVPKLWPAGHLWPDSTHKVARKASIFLNIFLII